jgi:hypothetical protein
VITEDDICNQLLDHWAEQNKQHLDDDEKCCYVLAVRAADEIRRLGAEVDALRADAERYRAMRREKGGMMRDIDKAIRLINDWNHDKEHATHGHAVWVGLKLIHEIEQLRAEVDALRGVHEAATRVFKFHAVNKRNFFMAFCDLESNLDRVAEIDAARKGE